MICAVAMLLASTSVCVYAEEGYNDLSWDGSEADVTFDYFEDSSYIVHIPTNIYNITYEPYKFTASNVNILANQQVSVFAKDNNSNVTMTNEDGSTATLYLRTDDPSGSRFATFYDGYTESIYSMSAEMEHGIDAGSYTGTTTFYVMLELKR